MSSIFLSHSDADKLFVRRLAQDLQVAGVRVWLDEAEMRVGDSLKEKLGRVGDETAYLGIVLSPNSVKSPWVQDELRFMLFLDHSKLVLVVIEDCEFPMFLFPYAYADFRSPERYGKNLVGILSRLGIPPFKSVFISYSHQDEPFAKRLYEALQAKGVRCWYAPDNIQGGKKLHEQIDEAIRNHDKLLLILSKHSMNSEWVKTEIANARRREISQYRRILFPIRLIDFQAIRNWTCFDADTGKDSARELREYFIPDFSNWKDHDSFEHAFTRLLRDLKADDTQPST